MHVYDLRAISADEMVQIVAILRHIWQWSLYSSWLIPCHLMRAKTSKVTTLTQFSLNIRPRDRKRASDRDSQRVRYIVVEWDEWEWEWVWGWQWLRQWQWQWVMFLVGAVRHCTTWAIWQWKIAIIPDILCCRCLKCWQIDCNTTYSILWKKTTKNADPWAPWI